MCSPLSVIVARRQKWIRKNGFHLFPQKKSSSCGTHQDLRVPPPHHDMSAEARLGVVEYDGGMVGAGLVSGDGDPTLLNGMIECAKKYIPGVAGDVEDTAVAEDAAAGKEDEADEAGEVEAIPAVGGSSNAVVSNDADVVEGVDGGTADVSGAARATAAARAKAEEQMSAFRKMGAAITGVALIPEGKMEGDDKDVSAHASSVPPTLQIVTLTSASPSLTSVLEVGDFRFTLEAVQYKAEEGRSTTWVCRGIPKELGGGGVGRCVWAKGAGGGEGNKGNQGGKGGKGNEGGKEKEGEGKNDDDTKGDILVSEFPSCVTMMMISNVRSTSGVISDLTAPDTKFPTVCPGCVLHATRSARAGAAGGVGVSVQCPPLAMVPPSKQVPEVNLSAEDAAQVLVKAEQITGRRVGIWWEDEGGRFYNGRVVRKVEEPAAPAADAAEAARGAGPWACLACTFENAPGSDACTICGTSRGSMYIIQCSEIFTLRNEKLHTET